MPDSSKYQIDSLHQALQRELEEQQTRQASYFSKTRTIFMNEHDLNVVVHEKPRIAAERMRALAVYLGICAASLERIAEIRALMRKGNKDAELNRDSSGSKTDSAT